MEKSLRVKVKVKLKPWESKETRFGKFRVFVLSCSLVGRNKKLDKSCQASDAAGLLSPVEFDHVHSLLLILFISFIHTIIILFYKKGDWEWKRKKDFSSCVLSVHFACNIFSLLQNILILLEAVEVKERIKRSCYACCYETEK